MSNLGKTHVIVGGVAAGASAAARIRRKDETANIIVLEKGPYVSFSNCGLPYRISGIIEENEDLILMTPELLHAQYALDVRVNNEVYDIDTENKIVKVKNPITGDNYEDIKYDFLVITPGSKAKMPKIMKEAKMPVFTLKTVPDVAKIVEHLDKKPESIVVIGGGFIGVETAENLNKFGIKVTLIETKNQILCPLDKEMSMWANEQLINKGVDLKLGKTVVEINETSVVLDDGTSINCDGIIASIGVEPNTDFLKETNIELDDEGYIVVNENYETNIEDVFAGGDAIKVKNMITGKHWPILLAGPANKQGRLIADRIFGEEIVNNGYLGSSIVQVFDIALGSTGLNEKELKENGIDDYQVAFAAPPGIVGIMPNRPFIKSKLIFNKFTGKIYGAQFVGEFGVDKRVDVISVAIKAGMTVEDLQDQEFAYAPPFGTGKDVINKIGYIANNLKKGDYQQVPFTEIYKLIQDKAQIFDVREEDEYNEAHFKNVPLLPMSTLRENLDKIDKSKPVYVHCRTGERSYNMTLTLKHYGFEAYNIAGSWMFAEQYERMMQIEDPERENIIVK